MKRSKDFYNKEAKKYDKKRWKHDSGKYTNRVQKNIFQEIIEDIRGKKVLEIGPGTGRFTKIMLKKGGKVTAIDISSKMIDKLDSNICNGRERLKTLIGDARNINISDKSFDYIVSINTFSHISNYEQAISECSRLLRDNGKLILNVPNYVSLYAPYGILVNVLKKSIRRGVFTKWYSIKEVKKVIEENSISVVETKGHIHLPVNAPNKLIDIISKIDRNMRDGVLKCFSPIIFLKARKRH